MLKPIPHSQPTTGPQEAKAASEVVLSGRLADGRQVQEFEVELAQALGRRQAVVLANGHQALELYLESLELEPRSPIALPSYTCAALRHSVERCGLTPEIHDVEEATLGLPVVEGTALAVNMFAVPCTGAAGQLEDCAMGFVPGQTGCRGRATLLSFYVTKMLTCGQGAALLTDDENLAAEWRRRLQYDNLETYRVSTNRQLTDVQAAIGRVQLQRYPDFLERRQELFGLYRSRLEDRGLKLHAMVDQAANNVLFRLPLQVPSEKRQGLIDHLAQQGIEAKSPVWRPLHVDRGLPDSDFPVSVAAQNTIVSLPFYPSLTDDDVTRVVDETAKFLSKH